MADAPSLVNLCINALKDHILYGGNDDDEIVQSIYLLPTELFDCLLRQLPALALHKLQLQMPSDVQNDFEFVYDCIGGGRKRRRYGKFDGAWKALFCLRWPKLMDRLPLDPLQSMNVSECESVNDWQQKYWEMHVQNCFDAAAEIAMLPFFNSCISKIMIPISMIEAIGLHKTSSVPFYLRLHDHCREFGLYVRSLRLPNVFCDVETSNLLTNSKLQGLHVRRICSKKHVDGLCKILYQNRETITTLKFVDCNISLAFFDAICDSLSMEGALIHGVKHFAVRGSRLAESNPPTLPPRLASFLSSGSLESLRFCDDRIGRNFAKLIFMTLLDASSSLSTLELSDNNISGWLSDFRCNSTNQPSFLRDMSKSLQSLRVLNLRGNNLCKNDMEDLRSALAHMPVLETLDLASNPVGDDGIMSLIPYFVKTANHVPLRNLVLKDCDLSCVGASELLEVLLELKYPLTSLSLADNDLGSQIAPPLGDFLRSSVKSLDVRDICLGSSGFLELRINLPDDVNLVELNISENRGGIQAAEFLGELISKAPKLLAVHAGYNLMPPESLDIVCSALKIARGELQRIDLMGNLKLCQADHASILTEFQHNGRPIILIPTSASQEALYDDDP